METKLERIAEVAKSKPNERFTSLIHLINRESLIQCHNDMKARKASREERERNERNGARLFTYLLIEYSGSHIQFYTLRPADTAGLNINHKATNLNSGNGARLFTYLLIEYSDSHIQFYTSRPVDIYCRT